jgi:hypothetical protein
MFIPSQSQVLRRVLDARQLGLKYIANVTYGYTSATFSGRMPAVEIADSIVQSGRETLEKVFVQHVIRGCSPLTPCNRLYALLTPPRSGERKLYTEIPIRSSYTSEARLEHRHSALGTTWQIQSPLSILPQSNSSSRRYNPGLFTCFNTA